MSLGLRATVGLVAIGSLGLYAASEAISRAKIASEDRAQNEEQRERAEQPAAHREKHHLILFLRTGQLVSLVAPD